MGNSAVLGVDINYDVLTSVLAKGLEDLGLRDVICLRHGTESASLIVNPQHRPPSPEKLLCGHRAGCSLRRGLELHEADKFKVTGKWLAPMDAAAAGDHVEIAAVVVAVVVLEVGEQHDRLAVDSDRPWLQFKLW